MSGTEKGRPRDRRAGWERSVSKGDQASIRAFFRAFLRSNAEIFLAFAQFAEVMEGEGRYRDGMCTVPQEKKERPDLFSFPSCDMVHTYRHPSIPSFSAIASTVHPVQARWRWMWWINSYGRMPLTWWWLTALRRWCLERSWKGRWRTCRWVSRHAS